VLWSVVPSVAGRGGSVSPGALFFLLTWRRLDKDMVDRN